MTLLPLLPNDWCAKPFPLADQVVADAVGALDRLLPTILASDISLLIVHPGYVDAEILSLSSYSIIRARDLELVLDPRSRDLLAGAGVDVVSFSDGGVI